jgi:hypothetical protein
VVLVMLRTCCYLRVAGVPGFDAGVELTYSITHPDGCQGELVRIFAMRYLYRSEVEQVLSGVSWSVLPTDSVARDSGKNLVR